MMKILLKSALLSAMILVFSFAASAQAVWTEWSRVYHEGGHLIEISFKLNPCKNGTISNSFASYFRYRTNFTRPNTDCQFSFDYLDCEGKTKTELITVSMEKPALKEWNQGQWFMGDRVLKTSVLKITDRSPKPRQIPSSDLDERMDKIGERTLNKANQVPSKPTINSGQHAAPGGTRADVGSTPKTEVNAISSNRYTPPPKTNTDIILDNLNTRLQNDRNTYNAVIGGLQEIGNILQQQAAKREAQEQAAEQRRRQEEARKQQQEAIKIQQEAERRAIEEENRRKREEAETAERNRQFAIDVNILGEVIQNKKMNDYNGSNVSTLYYIVYERNYTTGKLNVRTYSVNKYSDDTWMLHSDFLNKIKFKDYFGNSGIGFLFGAYTSKETAEELLVRVKANASYAVIDDSFLLLNAQQGKTTEIDKNFWNN